MATANDAEYLEAMLLHPDPVLTAPELADRLGVTQQAAHKKLSRLYENGFVEKKDAGSNAVVWWLTPEGKTAYDQSSESVT